MDKLNDKYKHYKGNEYQIVAFAKHSETLEELVVYKALYGNNEIWVRPKKMFFEEITYNGIKLPRFRLIMENIPTYIIVSPEIQEFLHHQSLSLESIIENEKLNVKLSYSIFQTDDDINRSKDLVPIIYCFECFIISNYIGYF